MFLLFSHSLYSSHSLHTLYSLYIHHLLNREYPSKKRPFLLQKIASFLFCFYTACFWSGVLALILRVVRLVQIMAFIWIQNFAKKQLFCRYVEELQVGQLFSEKKEKKKKSFQEVWDKFARTFRIWYLTLKKMANPGFDRVQCLNDYFQRPVSFVSTNHHSPWIFYNLSRASCDQTFFFCGSKNDKKFCISFQ